MNRKLFVIGILFSVITGFSQDNMLTWRGAGPTRSEVYLSDGVYPFKEYIASFEASYVGKEDKDKVYFIFLYDEENAHKDEKIEHLEHLIEVELSRTQNEKLKIIRELDFPSEWIVQKIPAQHVVEDFKREGSSEPYYVGHLTVLLYSKNQQNLQIAVDRINANKKINIHTIRDYEYERAGMTVKQFVVEKIKYGGSCMMNEDSLLLKQVVSVFDYESIIKKKANPALANQNPRAQENQKDIRTEKEAITSQESDPAIGGSGHLEKRSRRKLYSLGDQASVGITRYGRSDFKGLLTSLEFMPQSGNSGSLIALEYGQGDYSYNLYVDQWIRTNDERKVIFNNVKESGNLSFNHWGLGFGYRQNISNWSQSLPKSISVDLSITATVGRCNWKRFDYMWTDGTKDVRGYWPGIEDELINIPELGFSEGISVKGNIGQLSIKETSNYWKIQPALQVSLNRLVGTIGMSYMQARIKSASSDNTLTDRDEIGLGGVYQNIDVHQWMLQTGIGIKF